MNTQTYILFYVFVAQNNNILGYNVYVSRRRTHTLKTQTEITLIILLFELWRFLYSGLFIPFHLNILLFTCVKKHRINSSL